MIYKLYYHMSRSVIRLDIAAIAFLSAIRLAIYISTLVPQEIVNEVVSYRHGDIEALEVCPVAWQTFHSPSRERFFHNVTINSENATTNHWTMYCNP